VTEDVDSFARDYFPDYDKDALILDVRHNNGGNIDSWILDILQKKSWMYWSGRTGTTKNGDMDWDEQFAFRGHIVVLIDEHTASDGEGVARGMSELGLGKLIGTRTWGGGIWLSSDNHLVDGGIASAPEIGTFNDKFGWGMGIEQHGVVPDIEVDNNPRTNFDGKDAQLERAVAELKQWLQDEPVVTPKPPTGKHDMSLHDNDCPL
jgi:tricorn protease